MLQAFPAYCALQVHNPSTQTPFPEHSSELFSLGQELLLKNSNKKVNISHNEIYVNVAEFMVCKLSI